MRSVHRLMQTGLDRRIYPGAVLLVACGGRRRFFRAYGVTTLRTRRPVEPGTIFDLASLTKPLATTLSMMRLTERGALHLESTLGSVLSRFRGTDKSDITIRQLLTHRSGLPAYRPYFIPLSQLPGHRRKEALQAFLVREPLVSRPGEERLYSDIGFMILQWLVEYAGGQRLDRFAEASVYRPMGVEGVFFPGGGDACLPPAAFAATERCCLRRRVVQGEVHDENSYIMGGVAGQAGLFGSAEAVWRLLAGLTNRYKGRTEEGGIRPDTVRSFFNKRKECPPLGFDTPDPRSSSAGRFFGPNTIGHMGFTGTSFWVDLDREIIVILLTNRVHPSRNNYKIKSFRPVLHDEIMKTLAVKKEFAYRSLL